MANDVYGYVNGKPVFSHDEFIFAKRGFGAIKTDSELMAYAKKVTNNWQNAGWHQSFTHFHLGDYALDEPRASLTHKEYARLKELQQMARAKEKAVDDAREWRLVKTVGYADNSVEEIYEDKDGIRKTVMIVGPHGDVC